MRALAALRSRTGRRAEMKQERGWTRNVRDLPSQRMLGDASGGREMRVAGIRRQAPLRAIARTHAVFAIASALMLLCLLAAPSAQAYIGPGAGFALGGSMLVLLVTFALAFVIILTWPIRLLINLIRVGNPYKKALVKKVVILGLDGMDPGLTTKFMLEGRMPNFQKLAEKGVFRPLDTSVPSMSPVAWSTFATGVDASSHCIYDFLTRDPCTYAPMLSSTGE